MKPLIKIIDLKNNKKRRFITRTMNILFFLDFVSLSLFVYTENISIKFFMLSIQLALITVSIYSMIETSQRCSTKVFHREKVLEEKFGAILGAALSNLLRCKELKKDTHIFTFYGWGNCSMLETDILFTSRMIHYFRELGVEKFTVFKHASFFYSVLMQEKDSYLPILTIPEKNFQDVSNVSSKEVFDCIEYV